MSVLEVWEDKDKVARLYCSVSTDNVGVKGLGRQGQGCPTILECFNRQCRYIQPTMLVLKVWEDKDRVARLCSSGLYNIGVEGLGKQG